MESIKNKVLDIEDYIGNTIMAIEIDKNGNIIKFSNCNIADIEGDYMFDTEKDLIRLQADKMHFINEEREFLDYCYHLLYNYILKTSDKDLKELYDWYDVEYGAETSLCNIMFESLCNNYDKDKLEEEIKKIVGEC